MKNCHIDSKNEIEARLWLLKEGYEAFDNISACGPIDLIILIPHAKKLELIDIKTQRIINRRRRKIILKDQQEILNVNLCCRMPDGSFSFDLPEIDDYWMKFNIKHTQKKKPIKIIKEYTSHNINSHDESCLNSNDIETLDDQITQDLLKLNVVSLYLSPNGI